MTTKRMNLAAAFLVMCNVLIAQKAAIVNASLTKATVYYGNGATLEHSATAQLQAGSQELIISNLSHLMDEQSIQIACPENVVLLSYRYQLKSEVPPPNADAILIKMADSIKLLSKQVKLLLHDENTQNEVLANTQKLIETSVSKTPDKTISSTELIKLIEYYNTKIQAIKASVYISNQKREQLNDSIIAIQYRKTTRQNTLVIPTITNGQLVLQLICNTATNANFDFSYYTSNAGWLPTYDLRVKTIDNSLKLVYKAMVTQNTGIDWKQTKLTLTTNNPNQNSTAPILNPWFVKVQVPAVYKQLLAGKSMAVNSIQGISSQSLDEVVVRGYSSQEQKMKDENMEGDLVQAYTTLSESQLNTSFEIDLPYNIPSDGKAYSVGIKDENIEAGYKHYAVPKLDSDAFLLAELSNWETLNLMPGDANIIMDNVYLGKSFINPNTIADTLNISLGRDKRVAVKRTLVKEYSKSKTNNDYKTDDFTYEIIVKNNKKQDIEMLLKDQYPIAQTKEVEITLKETGNAEIDVDKGILNWKLKLKPGESKKIRFSYSIKYPKDRKVV
jgi:uncharacterized protein (TIGR02231 family)